MKRYRKILGLFLLLAFVGIRPDIISAAGLGLTNDTIKIGGTTKVKGAGEGAVYRSENPTVAYVNPQGVITGKKEGKTVIFVKQKKNKREYQLNLTVKENKKLPSIPVCYDETSLEEIEVTQGKDEDHWVLSAKVKNNSEKGTIKKIQYIFEAMVVEDAETNKEEKTEAAEEKVKAELEKPQEEEENGTKDLKDTGQEGEGNHDTEDREEETKKAKIKKKKITLTANKIPAGKKEEISFEGIAPAAQPELIQVRIYSGDALVTWDKKKETGKLSWGTEDKKAPVISGFVGKESYNLDDVCMVVYPDKKYSFEKYVKAVDDRDDVVPINVDTSSINWKKKGTYQITITASDSAGNKSKAKARVQVRTADMLDQMADQILKKIVKDSWSDTEKVKAIYNYMRKNYSYVDSNDHASWEKSAKQGLKYKRGNCFMYYSVSRLLLTRCGIPNLTIRRSQGHGNHWWNLVYVQGGWYHFDSTPRSVKAVLCLLTDKQLEIYSKTAYNSHIYKKNSYPKRAQKEINRLIRGRNTF